MLACGSTSLSLACLLLSLAKCRLASKEYWAIKSTAWENGWLPSPRWGEVSVHARLPGGILGIGGEGQRTPHKYKKYYSIGFN